MARGKIGKFFSSPKKKRYFLFLLTGLLGIIFILAKFLVSSPLEKPQRVKIQEVPPLPRERVLAGKIAKGGSLSSALRSQNLSADLVEDICRHLKPVVNLRQVKPGDTFEVRLSPAGNLLNFSYQASPIDVYQLSVTPAGEWLAKKKEIVVEKYWARVSGEIVSTLFEAMDNLGEQDPLVLDFAEVFSWEIDFNAEPQPGDRFQMLVEEYYVGETFVRYGRILYAEYKSASKWIQGIYFQPPGGPGDYYTPQGDSLRKALLRSPLKFTRISSGYSKSRRHPILGGYRPHYGVDYAAPAGSPVWAVADGTVVFCGQNGGYGKQIILKHPNRYQSMYGHLSRFAPGIRNGKPIHQKQIIGYVGSTGLSTAPHLDFRLLKNGIFRNPRREISPPAPSLRQDQMVEFKETTDPVIRWVQDPSAPKYQKVASLSSRNLGLPK
ncbi:MAG: M23 family metallopeptidase [Thermodesulfobacteriota bacterium]